MGTSLTVMHVSCYMLVIKLYLKNVHIFALSACATCITIGKFTVMCLQVSFEDLNGPDFNLTAQM